MVKHGIIDKNADYRAAGFDQSLPVPARPALIVIDMCNAYLDETSPLYAGVERERANIVRLLSLFREKSIPIIHTRVEYQPGGLDGGIFYKKIAALQSFDRGNPLADWPSDLTPQDGEAVITKQYASAFFATSLSSTLAALSIDGLYITGVSTSGCVRATALDTIQHGFIPVVVEDACGDRDSAVHDANIFDLRAKYADMISTDALINRIADG